MRLRLITAIGTVVSCITIVALLGVCNQTSAQFGGPSLGGSPPVPGDTMPAPSIGGNNTGATPPPLPAADNNSSPLGDDAPAGAEVLTRGPVHEAFANPIDSNPQAGPTTKKRPPEAIQEVPPDQQPEGDNIVWIPGYWAWDDEKQDFLWVSGVLRNAPPYQTWVPGYWSEAEGGYQWTPGFWAGTAKPEVEYLPQPPQTQEQGPNSPAPSDNHFWVPGNWVYRNTNYAWQPGYWTVCRPNWIWVPAHYVWSPSGYLFVGGFWDYSLARRGCLFAPIYFAQPVYAQPAFVYTPRVLINVGLFNDCLFVRPAYCSYYFGDYFAPSYASIGFSPWFSLTIGRRPFYDPLFTYYRWSNSRNNPNWLARTQQHYALLRTDVNARPPHTLFAQQQLLRTGGGKPNGQANNFLMAATLKEVDKNPALVGTKFHTMSATERKDFISRGKELQVATVDRSELETKKGAVGLGAITNSNKNLAGDRGIGEKGEKGIGGTGTGDRKFDGDNANKIGGSTGGVAGGPQKLKLPTAAASKLNLADSGSNNATGGSNSTNNRLGNDKGNSRIGAGTGNGGGSGTGGFGSGNGAGSTAGSGNAGVGGSNPGKIGRALGDNTPGQTGGATGIQGGSGTGGTGNGNRGKTGLGTVNPGGANGGIDLSGSGSGNKTGNSGSANGGGNKSGNSGGTGTGGNGGNKTGGGRGTFSDSGTTGGLRLNGSGSGGGTGNAGSGNDSQAIRSQPKINLTPNSGSSGISAGGGDSGSGSGRSGLGSGGQSTGGGGTMSPPINLQPKSSGSSGGTSGGSVRGSGGGGGGGGTGGGANGGSPKKDKDNDNDSKGKKSSSYTPPRPFNIDPRQLSQFDMSKALAAERETRSLLKPLRGNSAQTQPTENRSASDSNLLGQLTDDGPIDRYGKSSDRVVDVNPPDDEDNQKSRSRNDNKTPQNMSAKNDQTGGRSFGMTPSGSNPAAGGSSYRLGGAGSYAGQSGVQQRSSYAANSTAKPSGPATYTAPKTTINGSSSPYSVNLTTLSPQPQTLKTPDLSNYDYTAMLQRGRSLSSSTPTGGIAGLPSEDDLPAPLAGKSSMGGSYSNPNSPRPLNGPAGLQGNTSLSGLTGLSNPDKPRGTMSYISSDTLPTMQHMAPSGTNSRSFSSGSSRTYGPTGGDSGSVRGSGSYMGAYPGP